MRGNAIVRSRRQTERAYLEPRGIEGIVWHHPDGRMVKIKRRDFFKPSKQKSYR